MRLQPPSNPLTGLDLFPAGILRAETAIVSLNYRTVPVLIQLVNCPLATTQSKRNEQRRNMQGICCPNCEFKKSRVVYTRQQQNYITRRRECSRCETRFTTCERRVGNSKKD